MLTNILFTVIILFLLYFIGLGLLPRRYFRSNPGIEFAFATVCGSCAVFATAGLLVFANLSVTILVPFIGILVAFGLVRIFQFTNNLRAFVTDKYLIMITLPALVFIALNSSGLFSTSIRLRNGPDLVGWLVSARFLCNDGNLGQLKERIFQGAGSRDLSQIFAHPTNPLFNKDVTIGSIASTADQYSGEFLIGAERLGIPGFQAGLCKVLGNENLNSTYVAISAYAILLTTLILYLIGVEIGKTRMVSSGYAIFGTLNVAVFSVLFEGGFGQLISLPVFLLVGMSLASKFNVRIRLLISMLSIAVFAISSYLDLAIISIGFLVTYLILNFPEIYDDWRRTKSRKSPKTLKLFFLEKTGLDKQGTTIRLLSISSFLIFSSVTIGPLLAERLSGSGVVGGWGFGWFPTPANITGIVNWIPSDGNSHPSARSLPQVIMEFGPFLALVFVYVWSTLNSKRIQKSILVFYLLFLLLEFTKSSQYWNTYAIWKAGAYFAPLYFGFLIFEKRPKKKAYKRITGISVCCLFVSTITSFVWWGQDYQKNSISISSVVPDRIAQTIQTKDIYFSGFKGVGAGSAALTLLGDVHYLNPGRIGGVPTKRSNPNRELVYLLHNSFCHQKSILDLSCARGLFGLESESNLKILYIEGEMTALSSE